MCTTHMEQLEIRKNKISRTKEEEEEEDEKIPTDKCEELQGKGKFQ